MAITIREIRDASPRGCHAVCDHAGTRLELEVAVAPEDLGELLGVETTIELGYEAVRAWRTVPAASPAPSGIFPGDDGSHRIIGRVHQILALEGDDTLIDFHITAGPEFILIDPAELGGETPAIGSQLELVVLGLVVTPTFAESPDADDLPASTEPGEPAADALD